ncbi:hypothetical protein J4H86_09930 [Spiractinospora alimapuensis]|uniref:hypothetical protein n=1 Tax=Spiractinospora alimapuensis TaxID=2820884 RepID=UPI001F1EB3E8|nr:hypothetical protein [Spiractinospora alimapuensis]QVQ53989.1 hypothetical protein J4H86_09930 [Spiractinospora alimapuensis]
MSPHPKAPPAEPIRRPWLWVVLVLILLVSVPWYWPAGTLEPVVLGLPLWAWTTLAGSVALCGYLSWLCATQWPDADEEDTDE